jgi:hypothetical protein
MIRLGRVRYGAVLVEVGSLAGRATVHGGKTLPSSFPRQILAILVACWIISAIWATNCAVKEEMLNHRSN